MRPNSISVRNPYRYLRFCAWGGPIFLLVSLLFWGVLGHNIPPFSAALDAEVIARHFRDHANSVRLGMTVMMAFSTLYYPWGVAISKVMQAVERDNDVLSTLQRGGALFTVLVTTFSAAVWLAAAFRPEALDAAILQLLNDLAWIIFVVAWSLTSMQMIAIGVCFLGDDRSEPLFPKWLSWFSIWAGFSFIMEMALPFFRSGSFSRNGILNFWLEFAVFFWFILFVSFYLFRSITRLEAEHREAVAGV